jgi:esterase/lipase
MQPNHEGSPAASVRLRWHGSWRRRILWAGATSVGLGLGLVLSWFVAGWLIAPRHADVGDLPGDLPGDAISLDSESGAKLAGWHIRGGAERGVIVLLHPIRGSRLTMLARAKMLHRAGYSIVMVDFQSHGESTGDEITFGRLEQHDVKAAVDYARLAHATEPIGVIGVSLGGAAALLASPLDVDAMVLESVYPTIEQAVHNRVAAKLGPFATLPAELLLCQFKPRLGFAPSILRPIEQMDSIGCPVFVISGAEDYHTTAVETEAMYDAAETPKQLWLLKRADHVDLYGVAGEEYESRVLAFFESHFKRVTP